MPFELTENLSIHLLILVIFYIFKLHVLFNHWVAFLTIFQAKSQFFKFLRALS